MIFFSGSTSQGDRLVRFKIFIDVFSTYPEKTLLIGNGAELQGLDYERGITSGWLVNVAERGLFFTVTFAAYLFYVFRRKVDIFIVVAYFCWSFEFFSFPIFFL